MNTSTLTIEEIKARLLQSEGLTLTLTAELEDTDVFEVFESKDAQAVVMNELRLGNDWAFCTAKLQATFCGMTAVDYLGCCSYRSAEDFTENSGYYADMKDMVLSDIARQIRETVIKLQLLTSKMA